MSIRKRGGKLWLDLKAGGQRWRCSVEAWVTPRLHDPAWRAACRLSEGASLTEVRTIERHVEPEAKLQWAAFVASKPKASWKNPDDRARYMREWQDVVTCRQEVDAKALRAAKLIELWYAARCYDTVNPLRARYQSDSRVDRVVKWLGNRPATDLLTSELYATLRVEMASAGSTVADKLIAGVLQPAARWAQKQMTPQGTMLDSRLTISISTQQSRVRERVILPHELDAVLEALRSMPHADAPRVLTYVRWLHSTGARPWELALVRVEDVDFENQLLTLRAETTKSGKRRIVPIDPERLRDTYVQQRRFAGPDAYVFGHASLKTQGKDILLVGRDIAQSMRYRWNEAVAIAGLSTLPDPFVMRDLRRTAISGWHEAGLPERDCRYLAGHAALDVHGRVYDRVALEGLRRRMATTLWTAPDRQERAS